MTEEWRIVPSYPFLEASSLGRVRYRGPDRKRWVDGYVIPQQRHSQRGKYRAVSIPGDLVGKPSGQHTVSVHRLVCEAFHGPSPEGRGLVEHDDDDGLNNTPGNLFWSTPRANSNREGVRRKNSRRGPDHPNWGRKFSAETRAKMSAAKRKQ